MNPYAVIFREPNGHPLETPEVFLCQADSPDHAEEKAVNAHPKADILWISEGLNHKKAISEYYDAF